MNLLNSEYFPVIVTCYLVFGFCLGVWLFCKSRKYLTVGDIFTNVLISSWVWPFYIIVMILVFFREHSGTIIWKKKP